MSQIVFNVIFKKILRRANIFKISSLSIIKKINLRLKVRRYLAFQKPLKTGSNLPEENLILISHYKENLDWINEIKIPYLIYSKGGPIKQRSYLKLPNIGREGHSYLHFILKHWDKLPNRIIFSQGNPIEHNPDFLNILDNNNYFQKIQPLTDRWISPENPNSTWNQILFLNGLPHQHIRNKFSKSIPGGKAYVELLNGNLKTIFPYKYIDKGIMDLKIVEKHGHLTLNYLFEKLNFDEKVPNYIAFNYSGIFSVDRELILKRKKYFYKNLLSFLLEDEEHGILLERLWLTIFRFDINSWYPDLSVDQIE